MAHDEKALGALFGSAVQDRHSPLYVAMRNNFETIMQSARKGRLDWPKLIAGFAELGVMDGEGKPPTLRGAQQTWYRVKLDMGQRSRRAKAPIAVSARPPLPSSVVAPADIFNDQPGECDYEFQPASVRSSVKGK